MSVEKKLWTGENELILIDLISERSALWNPVHENYVKRNFNGILLEEVAIEMKKR